MLTRELVVPSVGQATLVHLRNASAIALEASSYDTCLLAFS